LNLRDARAVSRTNGRIYDAWRLSDSATDEKVARARAALIYVYNRPILWDDEGRALAPDRRGAWVPLFDEPDEVNSEANSEASDDRGRRTERRR
ncbi:MAG: hypothetical protein ABI068_06905, partial [Ktedonobacterales bacterium]